jgi:phosphoglycolate phosphatase-like HAD superfamily hydrolase
MTLTEIVQVGTAVGTGGGGVGLLLFAARGLVNAVSHALEKRSDAKLAEAEAEKQRAGAAATEAETEAKEQAHEDRVYDDLRGDIDRLSKRLDECEKRHRAAEARADEALRIATAQQTEIEALRREMQRRGWTPPEMLAAVPRAGGER